MNDSRGRDLWQTARHFHVEYILPICSFIWLVVAFFVLGFMIQALWRARIIPFDLLNTLSKPDLAVAAMSGLVTAATLLGVVVTAIGALVAGRTATEFDKLRERVTKEIDNLRDSVSRDISSDTARLQTIGEQLGTYEAILDKLKKDFQTPAEIRQAIMDIIKIEYEPANQLKAEIKDAIKTELYPKIIEEYGKALQVFRIVNHGIDPS